MRSGKLSIGLAATLAILFATILSPGTPAAAQTYQVLQNFNDLPDGAAPAASPIFDASGNLYGTTSSGGADSVEGAVFELTPATGGGWTETVLHSFRGLDGFLPIGGLVRDSSGNLYGTTAWGGGESVSYCGQDGCGIAFELSPAAGGGWTEKVLHRFSHNGTDGLSPYSTLVFDVAGNLYGTTITGGAYNEGTVFQLAHKASGGWAETVLYSFKNNSQDGQLPESGVIFDPSGNLYGTTANGGAYGYGTVFELFRNAGGDWSETILHSFRDDGRDGLNPIASLILDAAGNLYGTTAAGGSSRTCVNYQVTTCGTVFELSKAGGVWLEKVLYDFDSDSSGANPEGSLTFDSAGNLYGTTANGGPYVYGTVFELSPATDGWTETTLHQFGSGTDGENPYAGPAFGANGNLYGTTLYGGSGAEGTVFEIAP